MGEKEKKLLFIPFAAVTLSFDEYADKVSEVFTELVDKIESRSHFIKLPEIYMLLHFRVF